MPNKSFFAAAKITYVRIPAAICLIFIIRIIVKNNSHIEKVKRQELRILSKKVIYQKSVKSCVYRL